MTKDDNKVDYGKLVEVADTAISDSKSLSDLVGKIVAGLVDSLVHGGKH